MGNPIPLGFNLPATLGVHTIEFGVATDAAEVEDNMSNNVYPSHTVEVTEYIYARDAGTPDDIFYGNLSPVDEIGNAFQIFQNQTLYSIDAVINENSIVGSNLWAKLYEIPNDGDFILLAESNVSTLTAQDIGNTMTFNLETPVMLSNINDNALDYVVVIANTGGVVIPYSGLSDPVRPLFIKIKIGIGYLVHQWFG